MRFRKKDEQRAVFEFQSHPLGIETRIHSQPRLRALGQSGKRKTGACVVEGGESQKGAKGAEKAKSVVRRGLSLLGINRENESKRVRERFAITPPSNTSTLRMLRSRETNFCRSGTFSTSDRCHVALNYLPRNKPTVRDTLRSRAYIGQFSADGTLFVAGFQDRRIRLYDVDKGWALRKDVFARNLRWTITDTALSPNQQFLVYASINPVVHQVNVVRGSAGVESHANVTDIHEELNFCNSNSRERGFGIWAIQYSADGREIVAGTSDHSVYVYDMEQGKVHLGARGHQDDVNAVAFADDSSNVIFTGSDDNFCKVWDRRTMSFSRSRAVGILVGHTEGITHISSKGDGRYFISNGKDQTIKLWDIRNMFSQATYTSLPRVTVPSYRWDYRWMDYPGRGKNVVHPYDHSVMSYKGHHVLQTLIRCYFSPLHSTGQRFIYSGSHDGSVYIFDVLTGGVVTRLKYHGATVRDCSWHPFFPQIASTGWDGRVAHWEFPGGAKGSETGCKEARIDQYSDWF